MIPKAKLTVVKAGEDPVPYLRLCFTGVRLTSVSTGGSGGEDRLTENVTFAYATVVEALPAAARRTATLEPLRSSAGGT